MSRAVASPLRDVNGAAARRPVRLKRRALSDSSDDDASDEDAPSPATNVDAVAATNVDAVAATRKPLRLKGKDGGAEV